MSAARCEETPTFCESANRQSRPRRRRLFLQRRLSDTQCEAQRATPRPKWICGSKVRARHLGVPEFTLRVHDRPRDVLDPLEDAIAHQPPNPPNVAFPTHPRDARRASRAVSLHSPSPHSPADAARRFCVVAARLPLSAHPAPSLRANRRPARVVRLSAHRNNQNRSIERRRRRPFRRRRRARAGGAGGIASARPSDGRPTAPHLCAGTRTASCRPSVTRCATTSARS